MFLQMWKDSETEIDYLEEPPFKRGDCTIQVHTLIVDIRNSLSQDKHIELINVHLAILMKIMHF